MMTGDEIKVIRQTKKWITEIVIGCNFCPFAAKEIKRNSIHYQVEASTKMKDSLDSFLQECIHLDKNENMETSLLIFTTGFKRFEDYLELLLRAEKLLKKKGYEGVYQVASFHPLYCFADTPADDAANFTNRSPYPMLHLLREKSVEIALEHYLHPEKIPQNNISFTREKGYAYMKTLLEDCLKN